MSVNSEIARISNEVNTQEDLIEQIQTALQTKASGTDTSDATAVATDILSGKTAYGSSGKITGTMATATMPTPTITVATNGVITAKVNLTTSGYMAATSKSNTKNLTTQAAQTITPGTTNKTIASQRYLTGTQTIKGDANLVAANIKSGVSIFGVNGTFGGGEEGSILFQMIAGTLSEISNSQVTAIGMDAFAGCKYSLTSVNFPACSMVDDYAFYQCSVLQSVNMSTCADVGQYAFGACYILPSVSLPACVTMGSNALARCSALTSITLPVCETINYSAFYYCISLTTASFPACKTISYGTFNGCTKLKSLYLMGDAVCALSNSNAFSSTPIGGYSTVAGSYGSIYVPASLLTQYKAATNWTYFSNRMVGV